MRAGLCVLLWLVCRSVFAATPAWPDVWPRAGQAVFEVRQASSGLVVGRNEHRWQHDGREWSIRSTTEPAGVAAMFSKARAVQESRGVFVAGGMQPLEFRSERKGKDSGGARFDLAARQVALGGGEVLPFSVPTQDLLSLFYQLGALNLEGGSATFAMTTGRKLKDYRVSAGAVERIETALGARPARHLAIAAAHAPEDRELTEVWLDTATRLPVRIRYRDRRGDTFDQLLSSMNLGAKP